MTVAPVDSTWKITAIDTFAVKSGGWGAWLFCAVRTDEGVTGYSQFGEGKLFRGIPGIVDDLSGWLIGKDPDPVEKFYMDMYRQTRSMSGGATAMAIAGIELALWDIKGKRYGVPVHGSEMGEDYNPLEAGLIGSIDFTCTFSLPVCSTSCPGPCPFTSADGEKTRRYSNGRLKEHPSSNCTAIRRDILRSFISTGVALIVEFRRFSRKRLACCAF